MLALDNLGRIFLQFQAPAYFLLLLLLFFYYRLEKRCAVPCIVYPELRLLKKIAPSWRVRFYPYLLWLRLLALILLVFALARFQKGRVSTEVITHGVDIMMVLDTSGSMKAEDFFINNQRVTRMEAVRTVAAEFVKMRGNDRIGMVLFGNQAYTQCPLTLDHGILQRFLAGVEVGMAGEQTAIGSGIGTAINRLKDLESKSKVILLLTDGENNAGELDPIQAAEIAHTFGIKIYTIGVGTKGNAPILVQTIFGPQYQYIPFEVDEEMMRKISDLTGGQYFLAQNTEQLIKIYEQIDALEKTEGKIKEYTEYEELFTLFAIPAFLLLFVERLLHLTVFRRVP